jgi:hypothetical protein
VLPGSAAVLQTMMEAWLTQGLYVVTKLGVPEALRDGPRTLEELVTATGAHGPTLSRILKALVAFGYFGEKDGAFRLTRRSRPLLPDAPDSVRAAVLLWGHPINLSTFGALLHSARTGERAFDHVFGAGVFEYLEANPEANETYNEGMTALAAIGQGIAARSYDYAEIRTLVDVGGGHGSILAAVLAENPQLRGVLFDQPHVVAGAPVQLQQAGVADRCEVVGGSFFESLPHGHDAYLFTTVIHDWDDEHASRILATCRRAIPPDGRLLLVEVVLPAGNSPTAGRLIDLQVLVMHGSRERTEAEFRQLLAGAGFELRRVRSTLTPMSVLEAVPV